MSHPPAHYDVIFALVVDVDLVFIVLSLCISPQSCLINAQTLHLMSRPPAQCDVLIVRRQDLERVPREGGRTLRPRGHVRTGDVPVSIEVEQ